MQAPAERVDISREELDQLLERVRGALSEEEFQKLAGALHTLSYVTELLQNRETTLQALRRLLCHVSTEKTEAVLREAGLETNPKPPKGDPRHTPPSSCSSRHDVAF